VTGHSSPGFPNVFFVTLMPRSRSKVISSTEFHRSAYSTGLLRSNASTQHCLVSGGVKSQHTEILGQKEQMLLPMAKSFHRTYKHFYRQFKLYKNTYYLKTGKYITAGFTAIKMTRQSFIATGCTAKEGVIIWKEMAFYKDNNKISLWIPSTCSLFIFSNALHPCLTKSDGTNLS
jgi:hypothetical protein